VLDLEFAPVPLQILRHEPPVTVMRLFFTAQQAGAVDETAVDRAFDLTFAHQLQEALLVPARIHYRSRAIRIQGLHPSHVPRNWAVFALETPLVVVAPTVA